MVNNNLYKVENTLRSIAKRYKSVKYSLGLAILFLMMGVSAFSEEVVAQEAVAQQEVMTTEQIASSKDNLKDSIGGLKSKIDTARAENEKSLAGLRLELIQLMEQGNQVVKSPWSSWQFGANYIYNDWQSTYKGRGDKSGKYPYEGILTRSDNVYERNISPISKNYSSLPTSSNFRSASSNNRDGIPRGYGLVRVKEVQEPIIGFDVSAGVRPKQVVKGAINIADKNPIAPEQPEAISFNTPTINIAPPASVSVTAATPTVTAPTVTAPSPNVPTLPTALSFSPVTPTVTAPTAPTVTVSNPLDLSFNGTGFGQGYTPSTNQYSLYVENYHEYDTTAPVYLTYTATGRTMTGGTVNVKLDNGTPGTSLVPGTSPSQGVYFINDAADHSVTIKGDYDITRASDAGNGTLYFVSLNPYEVGNSSSTDGVYNFAGNLTLHGHNNPSSANLLLGFEHQLLANNGGGSGHYTNVENGTVTSVLKNTGTITLQDGYNLVAFQIDTEYTPGSNGYFRKQPQTINDGKIIINSKNSIGIDYGNYYSASPNTKLTLGNIEVNGENNYGFRMKSYYNMKYGGVNPAYYDLTDVTGGSGKKISVKGKKNVGISIAQGYSTGDPLTKITGLNIEVGGTNNVGFLRNSQNDLPAANINTNAMVLNSTTMGDTFNFDSTATGSALIRSDVHEVILDKDITVGATGVKNALMQAGHDGKVTLASGKKITSTTANEFYGMTAGNFAGADGKKAVATNKGELNIGGNKSLGMAIDVDDEGINNGKINFSGTSGAGVYNTGTFTSNSGSEINISGQSSVGAFNSGTNGNLTIANGAKIQGTADDTTGIYGTDGTATNNGTITMTANSVKGLVTGGANAKVINNKTVTVTGKGAVGAASLEGTITAAAGSITADGTSGIALYTGGTVGGTINANGGTIDAKNGAINVFADKGTINLNGATINTGANSLAFIKSSNGGIVDFKSATTANIATDGTGFYIPPASTPTTVTYTPFTGIGSISGFNNLSNLTLNMYKNSNVAVAAYVESDLSTLTGSSISGFNIVDKTGTHEYNDYLLYKSKLTADPGTTYAQFKGIALSNSSVINDTTLSTSDNNVNLMAQENTDTLAWVNLINNKTIELTGTNSLAMYASNGKIKNSAGANITIGDTGTAIYGKNKGAGDTDIENSGEITVGQGSTAIYAEDYTTTGLENKGTITLAGDNGIGMSYKPNLTSATTFENAGKIISTASKGTGMFASKDANSVQYTTLNSDTISLGANGVGMYTDASSTGTNLLTNTGKITVGDTGIGMYGYEEDTTGEITAGNSGIGIYSQGGAVNIGGSSTTPKITVGDANATAVFTTGSGQTVTSTDATYNIGDNSYGFVNTGSGNTLNISGGTGTLTDNGVFIYSSDTAGNITSNTKITSTGSNGSNFGIFSAGTVNNVGDITLTNGTGNVGVYAINNGNITNSGNVTLGASTSANRSIGAIANVGTVNNTGKITVNGQYGIGAYSSGSGSTINNTGDITLTGDETIGAYGANGSNINLNSGTVALTGNKSTGYYLDAGTGSTIASGAKIDVTGEESNGVYANNGSSLTYDGDTTVDGDAAYGLIVDGGSNVTSTGGTLTVKGTSGINGTSSGANTNRGSAALVVTSGSNLTGGLDVTADVAGDNSVGVYSAGSLAMNSANISAYDSGVNFFTDGGTISVGNNGGTSTVVAGTGTNKGALMFYTPSGNILLNGTVNATVEGGSKAATRGTAFYYTGGGTLGSVGTYTQLNPTNVATWARNSFGNGSTSTLGNLNLTMNQGSRLFLTERVNMDLSNTSASNLFSGLSASERPNITGAGSYRTFMLYHSHLNVDQAVNLDNANDGYNLMEISSSSITNNNTITGTKSGQIAIAQENDTTPKSAVTLTNNGTINLSGANSAGIYTKNGIINNTNGITVGNSSSGIYALNNTEISNTGSITTGGSSTGIYYSDIEKDNAGNITTVNNTTTGLANAGSITLNGDDSVGLTYEPGNITGSVTFENSSTGSITSTGDKNVGMFAKLAQNGVSYNTINNGNITLGNSASMSNPNVAMYTNASSTGTNPLQNAGDITVGDNSVGMYGFEEDNTGNVTVGNGSIGLYSKNGNVNVSGSITTGSSNESVGVYTVGSGQTITSTGATFNLGDTSFGFVNVGTGNNITSTGGSATLSNNGVYIYSNDKANTITNSTNITSTGTTGKNYGIYSSSQANNSGNIDFSNGVGNLGMYMVNGGTGRNSGTITVGASDVSNELFSVGMAAGYIGDKTTAPTTGAIENSGTINVNGEYSIGMYGAGNGTTVTNQNDIVLNASNTTGIYVEEGAKAINNGSIRTGASGLSNVTGVVLGSGSTLTNNGVINISGTTSKGALLKGGTIANYGTITVSGAGSKETDSLNSTPTTKVLGTIAINAPAGASTATITANGVTVTPTVVKTAARNPITVSANSIGLYVNTSGKDYTKSITGLGNLTSEADLIIGTEAAQSTTSKYIQVNDNKILDPYNNAILSSGVSKWDIYSGSLTWITTPTLDPATGKVTNLYMAKVPYTEWAADKDTYNFADGLEQRYGVEALGTKENSVFQKLNGIGNNEETLLFQAYDEMMGHQYANTQQRVQATGNILDKEFDYLRSEWQTASKSSNKVKTFGTRGEYKTDTAGIIDYKYNGYGVAYVHENEDIKLGRGIGWYTGIVQNTLKFKDIGKSKEEQLQAKVGIFKSVPFDDNNSLNWTISGDIFAGYNKMNRKYLVVDEIFSAKSKYYNYGVSIKNEIGKEFRLSEGFSLRPYAALDLEYGRVSKIREKSGEIKLDVKQNDYISVKPEVGTELAYKYYFGTKTFRAGLGVAYENELGKLANGKNKARVANTTADWFNIRGEKEDRRGNVKFDLNLGLDNQVIGVTGNVGYDTKGENVRGGVGLRVIF
ncbi:autotransporter-associated N-terminal domain-containing protein [Fusobacterium polymorphum]|uniref:autotransporter-associated N-terminal domain-containing protein n=2 Tax=Fusobacterium nucleatum subsp. polymorphum TaxID=76857 RepID=UPI0030CFE388